MNTLITSLQDNIATVTLNRGKSNAINREMVLELSNIFNALENDENVGAVILTGKENFFSAGLDLIELYHYDESQVEEFWKLFLDLATQLTAFKKPLIAAINGHSPAGGCVLALCCDARIMNEGRHIIGLNEVPVGIVVPNSIFKLYAFWLGEANAYRNLLEGKLFTPDEALKISLVDELTNNSKQLMQRATQIAKKYLSYEINTWQQSKLNIRKSLIDSTQSTSNEELELMLNQWWSLGTRTILKTLIEKLQKK